MMASKNLKKFPMLTVDAVIKTGNSVILIKRRNEPFRNSWALPGGFVEYNETVENAVLREAKEETGLEVKIEKLVGIYSEPGRDPRGHTVSAAFLCKATGGNLKADTDAKEVCEFNINLVKDMDLAFDHRRILKDALGIV
jgi:8-oxo-dGTP diphosphatase